MIQHQTMSVKFEIVQLPQDYGDAVRSSHLAKFASKSKVIRLEALQSDPASFSSNYDREVKFEDEIWRSRLSNTTSRTIIALDTTHLSQVDGLSDLDKAEVAPWIGTVVLMGPRLAEKLPDETTGGEQLYRDASDMRTLPGSINASYDATLVYLINAVYVSPTLRGNGVAKRLLESTLKAVKLDKTSDEGTEKATLRKACFVHVKKENIAAVKLYESMGFGRVGGRDITYNGVQMELLVLRKSI
jgi:GNAT superfamily N-acetyltransferase